MELLDRSQKSDVEDLGKSSSSVISLVKNCNYFLDDPSDVSELVVTIFLPAYDENADELDLEETEVAEVFKK